MESSSQNMVQLCCIRATLRESGIVVSSSEMLVQLSITFTSIRTERLFAHKIPQIERQDIGIQFHPLARLESFRNPRSIFSVFLPLKNCVLLRFSALMRCEI